MLTVRGSASFPAPPLPKGRGFFYVCVLLLSLFLVDCSLLLWYIIIGSREWQRKNANCGVAHFCGVKIHFLSFRGTASIWISGMRWHSAFPGVERIAVLSIPLFMCAICVQNLKSVDIMRINNCDLYFCRAHPRISPPRGFSARRAVFFMFLCSLFIPIFP